MFGKVLDIHLAEMSDTHVKGDECFVYVLENHSVEELAAEVEAGGRR